ncbi:MAG: DUF523 and DUF1722 domain-containing protein [Desulfobulbaceae bacterium]|nr:DUF523 and DUF1722 domain-containing protein [Desulfobulbaceae bacterium]
MDRDNQQEAGIKELFLRRLRIGVSSCLLGTLVRYDGLDQCDHFITGTLGRVFDLYPVCPEYECGMGVPRKAMRLVGEAEQPRLMVICSGADQTEQMNSWCQQKITILDSDELDGFIFKSKSPSCGMEGVKVYPKNEDGMWQRIGKGLFAKAFLDHFPLLPVTDELKLQDVTLRDNFIEQLFVCQRWRASKAETLSAQGLINFHSANKLQVLSHSETHYQALGKVVAQTLTKPIPELFADYEMLLMRALQEVPSPPKHLNVLQHILGYFKKLITPDEKQNLLSSFEEYLNGTTPLIVPITLLKHYASQYQQEYLTRQHYLNPHPDELLLRYHT